MKVTFNPGAARETQWYEYAVRFIFGGLVTVVAGLIATLYGPGIGGLFLAFPAIFPASVTLVECHEAKHREQAGRSFQKRATDAAGVDAIGASIGSIGLAAFGALVWRLGPHFGAWATLTCAAIMWLVVAVLAWAVRQRL